MSKLFGIASEFNNAGELLKAAKALKDQGYNNFETYSPFPIHGMDKAMGIGFSKLSWISLIGGLTGGTIGITLQVWSSAHEYKIIASGKPLLSIPAFIPVTFELTILFTAFATVFGMFALNKLPMFNHPMFNYKEFHRSTCDAFIISIDANDPKFDEPTAQKALEDLGGQNIELVYDEDEG